MRELLAGVAPILWAAFMTALYAQHGKAQGKPSKTFVVVICFGALWLAGWLPFAVPYTALIMLWLGIKPSGLLGMGGASSLSPTATRKARLATLALIIAWGVA